MSAESPHRSKSQTKANVRPSTVIPQLVTDPTILDSVAGFINEVVPAAYNAPTELDDKIQWAHFEQLENDESAFTPGYDTDNAIPPPLILIVGYSTGIQIWAIPATGEATQIASWRHSSVRVLRLLPTPFKTSDHVDLFVSARPLMVICDSCVNYNTLIFRSLKAGVADPIKQIQFKTSILNVVANRHSIVVTFAEKIAVYDAFTLDNRLNISSCYLSPGLTANPIALGSRWLAYAEKKLIAANRSGGGNEGEGVQSYTATVLHAAKSLGRGLRELTETVAGSLTGNPNFKPGSSTNSPQAGGVCDGPQKGIVTILDIESKNINSVENIIPQDAVIAHFVAHTEAIVCLTFDPSGLLLLTSDKRGHDFHVFRIQPHPLGPSSASVHHLYVLHRGDTTAKVQDMCFSPDSRWVTVSTLRGTTHVFPVTPYGGNISVRTHATAHVVNKLSRYQRSAGLTLDGRSSSPVSLTETPVSSLFPYRNPRFPPYPQPTVIHPLAQLRQPVYVQSTGTSSQRIHSGRQRLSSSSSEDNISLRVVACFAPPRAWMEAPKTPRETTHKPHIKPVESLFIMSCYGILIQYDLEPHPLSSVPREKICNDTSIELKVLARAQWRLHRQLNTLDIPLPLSEEHLQIVAPNIQVYKQSKPDHNDDHWLSQVEIVTHLGPHRRLWMGPQFTFKTYTIANGSVIETKPVDVRRSKPINMPVSKANAILIESGSASSCEQLFLDTYHKSGEEIGSAGENRLKEDLADAMLESPGVRDAGGHCVIVSMKPYDASATVTKVVNPLGTVVTVQSDDEIEPQVIEDAVVHENCDEALFRPVMAPKAVFYSDNRPKTGPPDHILTKSLEVNTEVAVRIIKKAPKEDIKCKGVKEICNKQSSKQMKSREGSPKMKIKENIAKVENKTAITKTKSKEVVFDKSPLIIDKTPVPSQAKVIVKKDIKDPPVKRAQLSHVVAETLTNVPTTKKRSESPPAIITQPRQLNEDNDDYFHSDFITTAVSRFDGKTESGSSEEEKVVTRKTRKPKTKLGVKLTKEKENTSNVECEIDVNPTKRSWNIVAASKPKERISDDEEIAEIVDFTFKLPKKDDVQINLIDIDENLVKVNTEKEDSKHSLFEDDFGLLNCKLSDEEKGATSSPQTTDETESDDSFKISDLSFLAPGPITPIQTVQSSSIKASKKKTKKKRK